ncbi:hypothetical protein [Vulgatibacter incomptus]|uniref:hypothetical protein n=1 Tax=Vulgatibacter incomptus TaxID=1391653 RepID=UPI0012F9E281|nr:hypothetical protein [Vulgatibacter incomptus]
MRRVGILLACLAVWGLALPAKADEKVIHEADRVVVKRSTAVNFNDAQVEGDLVKPENDFVPGRDGAKFDNLIKLRKDFSRELDKSADGL